MKNTIFIPIVISMVICALVFYVFLSPLFHHDTNITLCDVGQGLAIHMRIPPSFDMLYDTGPEINKLSHCLSRTMPLYDRTIDLVIISHNQKDHMGALDLLKKKYTVTRVVGKEPFERYPTFHVRDVSIRILHKSANMADENDACTLVHIQEQNLDMLLTGDISHELLSHTTLPHRTIDLFQVPHHGSKTGLTPELIQRISPLISLIGVGVKNTYGHPAPSIIAMINAVSPNVLRTDTDGTVVLRFNPHTNVLRVFSKVFTLEE